MINTNYFPKILKYLNYLFIANLSLFVIVFPYSKHLCKLCLFWGLFFWLVIHSLVYFKENKIFIKNFIFGNPINILLGLFLFSVVVSTIFSLNFYHSQRIFFLRYIPYFLFFVFGYSLTNNVLTSDKSQGISTYSVRQKLYLLIYSFLLGSIFLGIGGVIAYFYSPSLRLLTIFDKKINITNYLLISIPLSLTLALGVKDKILKWLCIANLFFLYPILLWNRSRACWLVIFLITLLIIFIKNKKWAMIFLIFTTLCFIFSSTSFKNRVYSSFDIKKWGGRDKLYMTAFTIFKKFPILGAGAGMYEKLLYQKEFMPPKGYPGRNAHLHAHNVYLELGAEVGAIGLSLFISIFFAFFLLVLKTKKKWIDPYSDVQLILLSISLIIIASLIFAVTSTTFTVGIQDAAMFWFLLGIGSGILGAELQTKN